MDYSILYSDTAIIIYEVIFILVMIILIRKLSNSKKLYEQQAQELRKQQNDNDLKEQLVNQHRR